MIYGVIGVETGKLVKGSLGKPLIFKNRNCAYRWYRNNGYSDKVRIVAAVSLSDENKKELFKSLNENLRNQS